MKIYLVDFEVSGHHVDLYWRSLTLAFPEAQIIKLLPAKFKNDPLISNYNDIIFFENQTDLICIFTNTSKFSPDALYYFISADYIKFSLAFSIFRLPNLKLRFLFVKSSIIRRIQFKAVAKFSIRLVLIWIILIRKNRKIAFIEKDAVDYWANIFSKKKVFYIPDLFVLPGETIDEQLKFDHRSILVIGAINSRKNIELLIQSCEIHEVCIRVVIRGIIDPNIVDKLNSDAKKLKHVRLDIENRFLTRREYYEYINSCGAVWLCYSGYDVGASGVLLDAIFYRKPIIATKHGYLGAFLSENTDIKLFNSKKIIPRDTIVSDWHEMKVNCSDRKKILQMHSVTNLRNRLSEFLN